MSKLKQKRPKNGQPESFVMATPEGEKAGKNTKKNGQIQTGKMIRG
jgi:hypothetical protein